MMRDLLYLSENKMRALVPQLPGQLRRRPAAVLATPLYVQYAERG